MRDAHSRPIRGTAYSMLCASVRCAALTVLLSSCSADLPVQGEAQEAKEDALAVPYSLVCVIHGDGDYLYHDTSGNEYNADEEALAGAKRVAQQNPRAEVFIFHQRPRRHFFFFFLFTMASSLITGTDGSSQMNCTGAIRNRHTSALKWGCSVASVRSISVRW